MHERLKRRVASAPLSVASVLEKVPVLFCTLSYPTHKHDKTHKKIQKGDDDPTKTKRPQDRLPQEGGLTFAVPRQSLLSLRPHVRLSMSPHPIINPHIPPPSPKPHIHQPPHTTDQKVEKGKLEDFPNVTCKWACRGTKSTISFLQRVTTPQAKREMRRFRLRVRVQGSGVSGVRPYARSAIWTSPLDIHICDKT